MVTLLMKAGDDSLPVPINCEDLAIPHIPDLQTFQKPHWLPAFGHKKFPAFLGYHFSPFPIPNTPVSGIYPSRFDDRDCCATEQTTDSFVADIGK